MHDDNGSDDVIGSGTFEGGVHWTLDAGGDDDNYWTGLKLDGFSSGGMAGPKLWGEDLLNVYTGRDDDGPLGIAVRSDPSIVVVEIVSLDGVTRPLTACGGGVIDGLRFSVGLAWPAGPGSDRPGAFELLEVRGLTVERTVVETYDLSFWDRMHHD